MGRKLRKMVKKGKKVAKKIAKSEIAREVAKQEMGIAAKVLSKLANMLKIKAKKMK